MGLRPIGRKLKMAINKAKKRKSSLNRNKQYYVLLAPYFILFFTFTMLPVLASMVLSFTDFNMLQFPSFVGWGNYLRLFLRDDVFILALRNTIIFAVLTGPIGYALSFTVAWVINELNPKLRALMTLLFFAPSISGGAFVIWGVMFSGDRHGWVNGWLIRIGLWVEPVDFWRDSSYILPLLIVVQLWMSLGVGFLSFVAGLQTVDRALYEASAIDGIKNRWQELWFITLPSMRPQLMFGAVMTITGSFAVGTISTALAGFPSVGYAGHTVITHLQDFGTIRFEMGYASAIATLLFLLMVGANKGVQRLLRKVGT